MRNILLKYFSGHPLTIDEVIMLVEEYMKKNNKVYPNFIHNMVTSPASQMLIQKALELSADDIKEDYTITRVFSKEGQLLMVY
jgi:hypothetical protein